MCSLTIRCVLRVVIHRPAQQLHDQDQDASLHGCRHRLCHAAVRVGVCVCVSVCVCVCVVGVGTGSTTELARREN